MTCPNCHGTRQVSSGAACIECSGTGRVSAEAGAQLIAAGATPPRGYRYCGPCDAWVKGRECPKCGADTDAAVK